MLGMFGLDVGILLLFQGHCDLNEESGCSGGIIAQDLDDQALCINNCIEASAGADIDIGVQVEVFKYMLSAKTNRPKVPQILNTTRSLASQTLQFAAAATSSAPCKTIAPAGSRPMGARKTSARWRAEAMRGDSLGAESTDWSYVTCVRAFCYPLANVGNVPRCSFQQYFPGQEIFPVLLIEYCSITV